MARARKPSGETRTRPVYSPTLRPVDLDDIPMRTYPSKAGTLIKEFDESGEAAAAVDDASAHFNVRLKEFLSKNEEYGHIEVVQRGGETFLRRNDLNGSEAEDEEPTE